MVESVSVFRSEGRSSERRETDETCGAARQRSTRLLSSIPCMQQVVILLDIDQGYSDPIVVNEYVSEDDALYLFTCQPICGYPVYLFFFQSRAMSRAAQTLYQSYLFQGISERFAGILASPVAVKDCFFELLSVLQFQLLYDSDVQRLLHFIVHCD